MQLTWPHAGTDWAPMLQEITDTYEEMAREIRKREHLLIVGQPNNDTWARDHGFITLVDDEGHVRLLDFCFNGWGEKFPAELDNAINRRLYDKGEVKGEYVDCLDFVLEGGSIRSGFPLLDDLSATGDEVARPSAQSAYDEIRD